MVDKEGAAPIYINIRHRSHRLQYYTGERIRKSDWDKEKQHAKARDLFLFSCFTIVRHSDLKALQRSNINSDFLVLTYQIT